MSDIHASLGNVGSFSEENLDYTTFTQKFYFSKNMVIHSLWLTIDGTGPIAARIYSTDGALLAKSDPVTISTPRQLKECVLTSPLKVEANKGYIIGFYNNSSSRKSATGTPTSIVYNGCTIRVEKDALFARADSFPKSVWGTNYAMKIGFTFKNYDINSPGTSQPTYPANINQGDILNFFNTSVGSSGTIFNWTVPVSGIYRIKTIGASGGGVNCYDLRSTVNINKEDGGGGRGAIMSGEFALAKGDVLKILVGQMGSSGYASHGGGGGTFVSTLSNVPLIVAGGGGGIRDGNADGVIYNYDVLDAVITPNGVDGVRGTEKNGIGGTNGYGGTSVLVDDGGNGAGGAGFFGSSLPSSDKRPMTTKTGANSFVSGGFGGRLKYDSKSQLVQGGFGGGGSGGWGGAGGGGGYSGGGGGYNDNNNGYGGGGGSFNSGAKQVNSKGLTDGHGKVEIEYKEPYKIQHIGSKSWSETTSYNGVDGKCTWSVPSGVQVGDLIIVMAQSTGYIVNSSIPSPSGYVKLHEKYGPAGYNGGESGSATFYKIATESDIDSKVTFYTPKNGSGIAFGSINVYRNAKILSSDIVNKTGFIVSVPGNQEEVVLLEQVRKEYPTPQGGYTRIAKHGYTATTMHQYFYGVTTITGSTDGDAPEYTIPWVLIGYNEGNEPPAKPESFTRQPNTSSMNLSEESVQLEWTASTDTEGDAISYEVELHNGSAWVSVASNIATNSYSATLPNLDTDKAQFRVRAVDSKGGQSDYTLGNVFTIATRLLLVQDNNIVKSFKDGVWKAI